MTREEAMNRVIYESAPTNPGLMEYVMGMIDRGRYQPNVVMVDLWFALKNKLVKRLPRKLKKKLTHG